MITVIIDPEAERMREEFIQRMEDLNYFPTAIQTFQNEVEAILDQIEDLPQGRQPHGDKIDKELGTLSFPPSKTFKIRVRFRLIDNGKTARVVFIGTTRQIIEDLPN